MADTLSSIHRFIIQNIRLHGKYCKYSQSVNYIKKEQNAHQHSCLLLKKKTHVVYEELNHFPSSCCQEYRWFLFFCCWRSGLVLVLISFCTAAPSWCWLSLNFSSSPSQSPSPSNISKIISSQWQILYILVSDWFCNIWNNIAGT